ncbi:MAG: hypothetical protein R2932_17520 [Caldilineaceae bacterium]
MRTVVMDALRQQLPDLPIYEITLAAGEDIIAPDPLVLLRQLTTTATSSDTATPILLAYTGYGDQLSTLCGYLDLQREALARLPHHLLFWGTRATYETFLRTAPNFASRLNGFFSFPGSAQQAAPAATTPTAGGAPVAGSIAHDPRLLHSAVHVDGGRNLLDHRAQIDYYRQRIADLQATHAPITLKLRTHGAGQAL